MALSGGTAGTGPRTTLRRPRLRSGVSGSAQAAADLAAARQSIDPQKIALGQEVFRVADKLVKGMRLFAPGHPTRVGFIDELHHRLETFLGTYGEMSLAILPDAALLDSEAVFVSERLDENFFFPLYQNGVRQLTFLPGLPREEIASFFEILDFAIHTPSGDGENDAVTLLWEKRLEHVGYVVIETFSESDNDEDQQANVQAEEIKGLINFAMAKDVAAARKDLTGRLEVVRRTHTIRLTSADLMLLKSENLAALDEMPVQARDDELGDLFALAKEAISHLRKQVEPDAHLVERYVEALLRALGAAGDVADIPVLAKLLGQILEALVAEKDMIRAKQLCVQIVDLLPPPPLGQENPMEPVLAALSSDQICGGVVEVVSSGTERALGDALSLIMTLPPRTAPKLLERLLHVLDRKRRRRLCDALARMPDDAALLGATKALDDANEELALDLLYLLRAAGGPRATEVLEHATRHAQPHVRFEALHHYLRAADPGASLERAKRALSDSEAATRRVALEHLVTTRGDGSLEVLLELASSEGFAKRDFTEKKRLYMALAQIQGRESATYFRERLARKNPFGRTEIDEERAAAAAALGVLRDHESRVLLSKIASSVLTRALVKHECEQAVALVDTAPPAPTSRAHAGPRQKTPLAAAFEPTQAAKKTPPQALATPGAAPEGPKERAVQKTDSPAPPADPPRGAEGLDDLLKAYLDEGGKHE